MSRTYSATIPLEVVEPAAEIGELDVAFAWQPGTPESGRFGLPEDYDPGEGEYFEIAEARLDCAKVGLGEGAKAKLVDWLTENWDRPEPGPDPDDLRDRDRDDRLTGDAA